MTQLDPDSEDARSRLATQDGLVVGIAGFALLNGMHTSPFFDPAFVLIKLFAPAFFITSPVLIFYFTSLLLATFTVMLAGVPAALFERATGRERSDATSLGIWLGFVLLFSLPSLLKLAHIN
jgi:hypothetical protein